MKILMIFNFFMFMNLYTNLMLILNYMFMNIYISPLKQLMFLIFYMVYMTINVLILKQNISLNLFILMIIFISGILILFSYFICLVNNLMKKNNFLILILSNLLIIIIIIIQTKQLSKFIMKNFNFNFVKNNKINVMKKLYLYPNYLILLMFIIFLMIMLIIMTKICYIENKNLRAKKWKK